LSGGDAVRSYFDAGDVELFDVVCVTAACCDAVVPAAERRSPDAAANGPLHTATVAAIPHKKVPATTPPRIVLIHALSCLDM
jgi:hypothetical protein